MTIKRTSLWTLAGLFLTFALLASQGAWAAETGKMIGQPHDWAMGLQDAASPIKEKMEYFHHGVFLLITGITIFVMALLFWVMVRYNERMNPVPSKVTHNTWLEVIWTVVPVLLLLLMVIPSMKLLYYVDRTKDADMTLTVKGNQWYWSYEYPDNGGISFSSNLVQEKDLKPGQLRLLSTDNPIVLPVDTNVRLMITATDVIHSFAVPAFGVKLDAVPGQFNETWVRIDKEGTFYGQCSELCGQGHGYMPIEVHAVSKPEFAAWVKSQGGKMPEEIKAEAAAAAGAANAAVKEQPKAETKPVAAQPAGKKKKAGAK